MPASRTLAGNCTGDVAAIATVTDASCEAGTATLGSSLTRPIHDIYVAGVYGSQNSALPTLADEMLDAPTGYQYNLLASVSATSPCKELNDLPISPTIAAADVTKATTTVSPGGEALTVGTDCEMSYTDPNGTRRSTTLAVYDTSAGDWMSGGPTTIYFNNSPPTCAIANCQYDTGETLINSVAMSSVDTALWFDDEEGDTLTITSSDTGEGTGADKRPAGTTISSGVWSGTPSCASGNTTGSFTITAADVANDTETVAVTWSCYDQVEVPNCTSPPVTMSACGASLEALNLNPGAALVYDSGTAVGFVKSTSPAAGASVNPFTTVTMTVSLGTGASGRRRTLGLGVGVGRFTPEVPTDGVFDDQFCPKFTWWFYAMAGTRLSGVTTVGPRRARLVTPSNTVDMTDGDGNPISGHIRADAAGALVCLPEGNVSGDTVTINMAAGEVTQFVVRRVYSTGTDATPLHVLY